MHAARAANVIAGAQQTDVSLARPLLVSNGWRGARTTDGDDDGGREAAKWTSRYVDALR
jgi:hypothetical protein